MEPSRPNPGLRPGARIFRSYNQYFSFLISLLSLLSNEILAQSTSGFKPSSLVTEKVTDFITNPNQNQRSLLNTSQLYSSEDVYTRGNYLGVGASATSTGQYGYLPQQPPVNYGQYGPTVTTASAAAAGIGYQQGPPFIGGDKGYLFPGPQFQFPFGGQFPPAHLGGHQQQQYPPPGFNTNQQGILPGPGIFYPPGFPPSQQNQGFPGQQPHPPSGFPYPPQNPGQGYLSAGPGNGLEHLFLGLPRQIRVPGKIDISLNGKDAEIVCEFPRFLLLIQKVYWHHKYDDPYGTYYDSNNGFGPRVTVTSPDKWKSFLRIRDYNEDDFGTYRCITSAILPDESPLPPYGQNPPNNYILRSPSTTTETSLNPDDLTRLKPPNKSTKTRESKDFKFLSSSSSSSMNNNRIARKIRFSRSLSTTSASTTSENYLLTYAKNYLQGAVSKYQKNKERPFDPNDSDLKKLGSETVYDPYFYHRHNDPRNPRNYFIGGGTGSGYQTTPFPTSTPVPGNPYLPGHHIQDARYGPYGNNYPTFNQAGASAGGPGGSPPGFNGPPTGLYAPFYKPSYGVFSIYQEIRFSPVNSRSSDDSSRNNKI